MHSKKVCADCWWHEDGSDIDVEGKETLGAHFCTSPHLICVVTGKKEPRICFYERNPNGECGPEGMFWEPEPNATGGPK